MRDVEVDYDNKCEEPNQYATRPKTDETRQIKPYNYLRP